MMSFVEPNFRCRVSEKDDPKERRSARLVHAADAKGAKEFLENRGLIVHKVEPYDFKLWKDIAKIQTTKAISIIDRKGKCSFKAIWSALKDHLQDLFNDKCAYCDAKFLSVAYGDVEHYRPKGEVTEDPSHPGYYWLAYEPLNYLPSCQKCNQGTAKKNQFPIKGQRARTPSEPLDAEEPLLLHPLFDNFTKHLKFITSKNDINPGWAEGKTDKGKKSIDVYRLNRQPLVDARREEQGHGLTEFLRLFNNFINVDAKEVEEKFNSFIKEYSAGRRQFSAAVIDEITALCAKKSIRNYFSENGSHEGTV